MNSQSCLTFPSAGIKSMYVLPYTTIHDHTWFIVWTKCFLTIFYLSAYNPYFLWLSIAFSCIILISFSLAFLSLVMTFDLCSNESALRADYKILDNSRILMYIFFILFVAIKYFVNNYSSYIYGIFEIYMFFQYYSLIY